MRFRFPRFALGTCFEGVDDNITTNLTGLIVPLSKHLELLSEDLSQANDEENLAGE
jgi:hypothetical protein